MTRILAVTGVTEDESGNRGSASAGKDTVADFLVKNHGAVRIGLGDMMKRIAQDVYDFTDDQLWGPSSSRNAPDFRYPRPGDYAEAARHMCDKAEGQDIEVALNRWGPLGWLTPRHSLQILGTEWGRDNFEFTWILPVVKMAQELSQGGYLYDPKKGVYSADLGAKAPPYVVISDVRFPATLPFMKKQGGLTIRVKRNVATLQGAAAQHVSETALLNTPDSAFDEVIENYGNLEELETSVKTLVSGLAD